MWHLSVSGIGLENLEPLIGGLPAANYQETLEFAHKFWFKDQHIGLKWLKALSSEGVLIQEFKEDHAPYLNRLLDMYKGDAK